MLRKYLSDTRIPMKIDVVLDYEWHPDVDSDTGFASVVAYLPDGTTPIGMLGVPWEAWILINHANHAPYRVSQSTSRDIGSEANDENALDG